MGLQWTLFLSVFAIFHTEVNMKASEQGVCGSHVLPGMARGLGYCWKWLLFPQASTGLPVSITAAPTQIPQWDLQEIHLIAPPHCFKERPKSTSSPSQQKPGLVPLPSLLAPGPCVPAALAFFKVLESPPSLWPQEPCSHCLIFGDTPLPSFTYCAQ